MQLRMNWITLRVRDLEASLQFYHRILGLPVERQFESRGRQIVMLGQQGQPKIELVQGSEAALKSECGVSVGFEVASLEDAIEELNSHGIPVPAGPSRRIRICGSFMCWTRMALRCSLRSTARLLQGLLAAFIQNDRFIIKGGRFHFLYIILPWL
ncbi:VOC family protein [Paenibacillus sp. DMB5]|uniref:VOC family protein n=1 Tax=Paenibacillus sp. DMB5 TaxID=1780103 RepID=UPI000A9CE30D|nr:VOC family protein [Paenibacillus sp. DMB5]